MSDYAVNLLKAIEGGDSEEMDTTFSDAINSKISDALDAKKIEVAQATYSGNSDNDESEESIEDDTSEEDESEEDDTEEV